MQRDDQFTRRDMLKTTAALGAAATLAGLAGCASSSSSGKAPSETPPPVYTQGSTKLRIALIGCGGRGTGAAGDCLLNNENVALVAMGDALQDRLDGSKKELQGKLGAKFQVKDDMYFVGLDAYKKVLASDVDLVILATPPGFRPIHIAAAVEAGKHIFAEKPVATDPVGVRSVLASAEKIKAKKLGFVCGSQRRHQAEYIATIQKIHDGEIGQLVGGQCYWNQGFLWSHPRQPGWSDLEYEIRNWLYFTWLSGDHIVEQHVHNIDVMNWCFGGPPVSAYGMGGRQVRVDPLYGNIFDHFAIEYTYANGAKITSMCRQIDGTDSRVAERVVGTKGTSDPSGSIFDLQNKKTYGYKKIKGALGPYQQEHVDLINSIRAGEPLNEAKRIAESTLTAIMGRMSAYTGKEVSWDQAMNSKLNLWPGDVSMEMKITVPSVPVPGKDPLI